MSAFLADKESVHESSSLDECQSQLNSLVSIEALF